jgi:hypothetical protein
LFTTATKLLGLNTGVQSAADSAVLMSGDASSIATMRTNVFLDIGDPPERDLRFVRVVPGLSSGIRRKASKFE